MERIGDIHAAVSSVLKQTLPAHEIIVAVDHNDELCRALREQLPPSVAVVPNDGVRGISDNRNVGMRAATGDVIVYIDDDAVAGCDRCRGAGAAPSHKRSRAAGLVGSVVGRFFD